MSDLKKSINLITGTEPTSQQLQRIQAIAHELDIPSNDAMFPILVMLDSYHGAFSRLPAEVAAKNKQAAEQSAQNAATAAQAEVNRAVAALIPSIENAVTDTVVSTVRRIQLGDTMLYFFLGTIGLTFMFALGWVMGAHIFTAAETGKISWDAFFSKSGWGIGIGAAVPGLLLIWGFNFGDSEEKIWWQWLIGVLGLGGAALLVLNFVGFF